MILKRIGTHLDFSNTAELREYYDTHIIKEAALIDYELNIIKDKQVDRLKDYKMLDDDLSFDEMMKLLKKYDLKTIEIVEDENIIMAYVKSNANKNRNRKELVIRFEI